jgi:preprotein translocase subunit SecG
MKTGDSKPGGFSLATFLAKVVLTFVGACASFDAFSNLNDQLFAAKEALKKAPWALPQLFFVYLLAMVAVEVLQHRAKADLESRRTTPELERKAAKRRKTAEARKQRKKNEQKR